MRLRSTMMAGLALVAVGTMAIWAQAPVKPQARASGHTSGETSAEISSGVSTARLARIDAMLQTYVDQGLIPGAVALVLRDGRPVYQKAVGWVDREAHRPMQMDTVFRIASQTKAITSVAVLTLVEEGKLSLGDPVSR